mmetsp:Transcript_10721/g.28385  ORF Transcript_10721/g.28385 Transcript_10721/m.28385 type:complete len:85 (+) Transcript_10721:91-345(+)
MAVTLVHSDMPDWLVGPVFTALAVCLLVYTSCWVVFLVLASMRVEKLLEWSAIFETQAWRPAPARGPRRPRPAFEAPATQVPPL